MEVLIVKIKEERYAFDLSSVIEIVNRSEIHPIPESDAYIEGFMKHREGILPVCNFRSLLGFQTYESEQRGVLKEAALSHTAWVKDLQASLESDAPFEHPIDPHSCFFGKWIDSMLDCLKCNNHGFVNEIKKSVVERHYKLHEIGQKILDEERLECRRKLYKEEILPLYNAIMTAIEKLTAELHLLIDAHDQIIVYEINGKRFGIIIDLFDNITEVASSQIHKLNNSSICNSDLLSLESVIYLDNQVIMCVNFSEKFLENSLFHNTNEEKN